MPSMPDVNIIITLLIILFAIVLFAIEIVPVDVISVIVVLALIYFKLLSPDQAFTGFSNSALVMIGSVLIMTTALVKSGVADKIAHFILKWSGQSSIRLFCTFLITVGIISSFINNVAAVAILLPSTVSIAKAAKINSSKLLMPLAFGSMMGGMCTLIGTSTNIAVSGALPNYDMSSFSMFEITPIGLIVFFGGLLFFMTLGYFLLPAKDKDEVIEDYGIREYLSELKILPSSPLVGEKVSERVFGNMQDLSIVGIYRKGNNIYIPGDHFTIESGDSFLVVGGIENLARAGQTDGIEIKSGYKHIDKDLEPGDVRMAEAVIAPDSILEGKTLKDVNFRHTYGLSAIALYRHSICLREKVGRIPLRVGDVLLLQGEIDRIDALGEILKLIIMGDVTPERFRTKKAGIATIIFLASIIAGVTGLVPIAVSFLTGAALMVLSKCLYAEEVYKSVNWHILILIGGMISLGLAVEQTGTAQFLANLITDATASYGIHALLGSFFILTVLLTQPMSNVAAALLILPIAIHTAQGLGVNPRTFVMTITIAASCSFMTPFEPAAVLVYGTGRYRFIDFIRVGLPLTIVVFIISMLIIPVLWPL